MFAIFLDENLKEVKRIEDPDVSWVIEQLNTHVCQVFFRKRLNGRFRSIKCTRNALKLPPRYRTHLEAEIINPHGIQDIIPVWEIMSRDWKSFYYNSILVLTIYLEKGEKLENNNEK